MDQVDSCPVSRSGKRTAGDRRCCTGKGSEVRGLRRGENLERKMTGEGTEHVGLKGGPKKGTVCPSGGF